MRRGGGVDTLPAAGSRGSYVALDVTNPAAPVFLWEIDNTTTGFSELGETWAEPVFGKVRIGGSSKLVAIVGAGYDNNEDLRFGNTQTFPDGMDLTTETTLVAGDATLAASLGTSAQFNPKGRGIYIIQMATLSSSGVPTVTTTPTKVWDYTYDATRLLNNPTYSFPSQVTALDTDFNDYLDTIYVGDTGGNMWRFDIGNSSNASAWSGTKIFSANPSDVTISAENPATNGRKIFYPPSVVVEGGFYGLYFGTGDRAHPLNEGTIDRMYAVFDRGQTVAKTEADMVNLTIDQLQLNGGQTFQATCTATSVEVNCVMDRLQSSSNYGWFIKLDEDDGEKALAPAVVFNKVAYFTTFTPTFLALTNV